MERNGVNGEEEDDEDVDVDPSEIQRRKDRLEREQWLREQVGCRNHHGIITLKSFIKYHLDFGEMSDGCFILCVLHPSAYSLNRKPRKEKIWTQRTRRSERKTVSLWSSPRSWLPRLCREKVRAGWHLMNLNTQTLRHKHQMDCSWCLNFVFVRKLDYKRFKAQADIWTVLTFRLSNPGVHETIKLKLHPTQGINLHWK